jgi:hypothetical protein
MYREEIFFLSLRNILTQFLEYILQSTKYVITFDWKEYLLKIRGIGKKSNNDPERDSKQKNK